MVIGWSQREQASGESPNTSSAWARVEAARGIQQHRGFYNARIPSRLLRKLCALDEAGERTLEMAVRRMGLSARAHDRILKVARTIADLDGGEARSEPPLPPGPAAGTRSAGGRTGRGPVTSPLRRVAPRDQAGHSNARYRLGRERCAPDSAVALRSPGGQYGSNFLRRGFARRGDRGVDGLDR